MEPMEYFQKCVNYYVENVPEEEYHLRVFIDTAAHVKDFLQIGGMIFIPNSEDIPYNGVFVRTPDIVEHLERIDESAIENPYVDEIEIRKIGKAGIVYSVTYNK
jgi:hypothetical protein